MKYNAYNAVKKTTTISILLLIASASLNLHASNFLTAVGNGELKRVKTLLAMGVNPNLPRLLSNTTPLILAIMQGHTDIAHELITAGAQTDLQTDTGLTALHFAIINNNLAVTQKLITAGAQIDLQNNSGMAALHMAIINGDLAITEALIIAGAQIDLQNDSGLTALHMTIQKNNIALAKALIIAGAQIDLQNDSGMAALHMAVCKNDIILTKELLAHDADIHLQTFNGNTPLEYAAYQRHLPIAKLLINIDATASLRTLLRAAQGSNLLSIEALLSVGVRSDFIQHTTQKESRHRYQTTLIPNREGDCAICLQNLNYEQSGTDPIGQPVVLACPASHEFHKTCIQSALRHQPTCPECRAVIKKPLLDTTLIDTLFVQIEQELRLDPFTVLPENISLPTSALEEDFLTLPFRMRDQLRELQRQLLIENLTEVLKLESVSLEPEAVENQESASDKQQFASRFEAAVGRLELQRQKRNGE